jgi:hypothetical protein
MNPISNIWNHPKTSAAGLLISIVTIAGVLGQQGVTLGHIGTGSVVALVSGLGSALLGLLARDPGPLSQASSNPSPLSNSTARLGAWALIALLLPLPFIGGCSGSSVAQDIVNWTPALESAVATVDTTASLLAPADAPIFTAATAGFDAAANTLATQAKAYLANPSASLLAQLQTQITTLQQQVNSALLSAAHISDASSQKHALTAIQAVSTIVESILALVQSVSSHAAVAVMASQATIKLATVQPFLMNRAETARLIASHYNEPVSLASQQVAQSEQAAQQAGF